MSTKTSDSPSPEGGAEEQAALANYATGLREGPEAVILRMLALFDRPASPEAIAELRAEPAIPWLTEPLMGLSEEDWQRALSNLREDGLLLPADPHQPGALDVPPLVRRFFREYLQSEQPEGWQAGDLRLRDFRRDGPVRPPET